MCENSFSNRIKFTRLKTVVNENISTEDYKRACWVIWQQLEDQKLLTEWRREKQQQQLVTRVSFKVGEGHGPRKNVIEVAAALDLQDSEF